MQLPQIAPTAKLPLVSRKDIKDNWDARAPELNAKINTLLGEKYTLVVDFPQFHAYCVAANSYAEQPGNIAYQYFESFVEYLDKFTENGKYEEAKKSFNELISTRQIIFAADPEEKYSACRVKDDALELTYNATNPGVNIHYVGQELPKAFDKGLFAKNPKALPLVARIGIRDDWEKERERVASKIKDELNGFEVQLKADYEAIWGALVDGHEKNKDVDLESGANNLGSYTKYYFEALADSLNYKFKKDEMMVEAFQDACSTKEIHVLVVPEGGLSSGRSYNDTIFEGGKVLIRTVPRYWGTNVHYAAENIADLL